MNMGPQIQDAEPIQPGQVQENEEEDEEDQAEAVTADRRRRPNKRPAARGTAFYPRKRANTACQVCRARKTKCDNRKPSCSYCLSVGAKCIQSPVDLSAFDPASLKILERLDDLESLIKEDRAWNTKSHHHHDSPIHQQTNDASLISHHTRGAPSSLGSGSSRDLNDMPLRSILPEKVDSLLLWSIFTVEPPSLAYGTPGNDAAALLHGNNSSVFSPSNSSSLGSLVDIEPQSLKTLLENFFLHVHCKNPIFEKAATRRMVTQVFFDGIDWSPNSCLALLICALGRIATPLGPSLETKPETAAYTEAWKLFNAAQKRIGVLLCQTGIIGAQCLFLSGVFMMCVYQPFPAWRFFSQALAACQNLPFLQRAHNRTVVVAAAAATTTAATQSEAASTSADSDFMEMKASDTQEQAVYWSAWKSERELRGELVLPDFNMPHSTSLLYPPFFPTPPQPLEAMKTPDSDRQRASWLFYLAEISLRRISSRVCNEILQLHRTSSSNMAFLTDLASLVPDYEAQVQRWSDSLPPQLSISTSPEKDNICVYVLRGHYVNFFETIYWPFVMAHFANLECGNTTTVLPGQQEYVAKGLGYHIRRVYVNEPGFLHRHHGTWPMIRGCIRSAIVLLAARLLGAEMPAGWQSAVNQIVHLLSLWEDEIPDLAEPKAFLQHLSMSIDT